VYTEIGYDKELDQVLLKSI